MLSYWDVRETHMIMSFWIYVMLTLPLRLTSESFLAGGEGGENKLTLVSFWKFCVSFRTFSCSMYLKTFKRWLHFLGEQKNSSVFHFCACFHAWVADHVITLYDRVFALPPSLPSPCLPGLLLLDQFISDHWSDPKRIGLTELQASDRTHTGGAKIFFQRYPQFSSTIFSPNLSS